VSDHFFQSLNPPYLTDGSRYLARLNFPKYLTAETLSAQRISLLPNRETTIGQKSPGLNLSLIRSDKESFCLSSSPDKQKMLPSQRSLRLRGEKKMRLLGRKFLEDSCNSLVYFLLSGLPAGSRVCHICRRPTPEEFPCLGIDNIEN